METWEENLKTVGGRWDVKSWGGDPRIEKISLTNPHHLRYVNRLRHCANHNQ